MNRLVGARRRLSTDRRGAVAVEFALLFTLMLTMALGVSQFGIAFYNKTVLIDATRAAARTLAIGRTNAKVWSDTRNAFFLAAPTLKAASASVTITVNGNVCGSDSACIAALGAAVGQPVRVRATYPCNLKVITDFAPGCQMASTTVQKVE